MTETEFQKKVREKVEAITPDSDLQQQILALIQDVQKTSLQAICAVLHALADIRFSKNDEDGSAALLLAVKRIEHIIKAMFPRSSGDHGDSDEKTGN